MAKQSTAARKAPKKDPWADHAIECAVASAQRYLDMGAPSLAVAIARGAIATYGGYRESDLQPLVRGGLDKLGYRSDDIVRNTLYFIGRSERQSFWALPDEHVTCWTSAAGIEVRIGLPNSGGQVVTLLAGERVAIRDISLVTVTHIGDSYNSSYSLGGAK